MKDFRHKCIWKPTLLGMHIGRESCEHSNFERGVLLVKLLIFLNVKEIVLRLLWHDGGLNINEHLLYNIEDIDQPCQNIQLEQTGLK